MGFLFVSPVVCLQLPSDSTSRWTPLLFSYPLPTAGQGRDFHPIERAPAGRTVRALRANGALLLSSRIPDNTVCPDHKLQVLLAAENIDLRIVYHMADSVMPVPQIRR